MDDAPLDPATLPAILAGPVLRRVTRTMASVWVALSKPDPVTLHIRPLGRPAQEIAAGQATPLKIGSNLWLTVVTGTATLEAGQIYEYRLSSPM